jgi:hypothetical protein
MKKEKYKLEDYVDYVDYGYTHTRCVELIELSDGSLIPYHIGDKSAYKRLMELELIPELGTSVRYPLGYVIHLLIDEIEKLKQK